MKFNKFNSFTILLSLFFFASCVPAKKYKALQMQLDSKEIEVKEAKASIASLNTQLEALQEEKRNITQDIRKLTSGQKTKAEEKDITIQNLRSQVKILESKVATFEGRKKATTGTKTVTKKQKNSY